MLWETAGLIDIIAAMLIAFQNLGIFNPIKWIIVFILVIEAFACMIEIESY